MRLKDKVAIVTGSSRSIGRAIALGYGREGAKVVVNYHSDSEAAQSAVAEIERMGSEAIAVRADTSSSSDVSALVATAVDRFGRIDILVNNAGILIRTPFLEIEESEWDRILEVNLKGFFLCSQAAAKAMVRQGGGGVIINMSSAGDTLAGQNLTHYCVAKGGVRMLTRQLAFELAPHKIRANAIAPGLIETDLNRADLAEPEFRKYRLSMIPLGIIGVPEDIVGAAVFLASEDSRMATGATIYLDAGQTIA
ncbi:MAG: glucose 1-dehydrogenase [bacterium]|nr:glucose 1-dehydrogenase [Acidimicrobiia bacterium]MCY4650773.1 glucose 1-dehydrogenase [bacterium]